MAAMNDVLPVIVLAATNVALIAGWIVTGTQRVSEALTTERRAAYADLFGAADAARLGADEADSLVAATRRAEFLASSEMARSGLLERLASSADTGVGWDGARVAFLKAARLETQENSAIRRRLHGYATYGAR